MKLYKTLLLTAGAAALALAGCNQNAQQNAAGPNGAYVGGSNDTSMATGPATAPPPGSYKARAHIPPPPLPVYDQPPMPDPGYIWTPGYWAWSDDGDDYYWVPGTWVEPPQPELLWTPAYWGWVSGRYVFFPGYWGREVGFYGGIDYGFGYSGDGYFGGRWDHGAFFYNRTVNNKIGRAHV